MTIQYLCKGCRQVLETSTADSRNQSPCKTCGSSNMLVDMKFEYAADVLAGRHAISNGEFRSERVSSTDGITHSEISKDTGQPASLLSNRKCSIKNFNEETPVAQAFAKAFSSKTGINYFVKEKKEEDSDYYDRILGIVGKSNDEFNKNIDIGIQITHMKPEIVKNLNVSKYYKRQIDNDSFVDEIRGAIRRKSFVDPKLKRNTILVLHIPAPLGEIIRTELQKKSFDLQGFKEIWICPFREECFEIFAKESL